MGGTMPGAAIPGAAVVGAMGGGGMGAPFGGGGIDPGLLIALVLGSRSKPQVRVRLTEALGKFILA